MMLHQISIEEYLSDLDIWCGKTSQAHSVRETQKEKTSGSSSKKSAESAMKMPLYLDLRRENGCLADASWEMGGALLGEYMMHSFGESPQRRKRISLVADFGGESAPEILFERKGLSGDSSEVEGSGQGVTTDSRTGSDLAISFQERAGKPGGVRESSSNMNESEHCPPSTTSTCVVPEGNGSRPSHHGDGYSESEVMYTLNGTEQHSVCTEQRESLCVGNGQMHQVHLQDKVGALNTMHDQQMILDVPKCYGLDRASFNQGKNALYDFAVEEEIAQPLVARGPGGVMTELSVHSAPEITKE